MKAVLKQFAALVLLASPCALAQGATDGAPAVLQAVNVVRADDHVLIEITLSSGVQSKAETAVRPDRVIVEFQNTFAPARQQRTAVNALGLREVRVGLHSANPPVTRLVVDMDRAHPYTLTSQGNSVVLRVDAAASLHRGAPAAAASAGVAGIFRRRSNPPPATADNSLSLPVPAPPPPGPPLNFPAQQNSGTQSTSANAAAGAPSAAHPNKGSLQEGTVFPSLGTPGAGNVPGGQVSTGRYPAANTSQPTVQAGKAVPAAPPTAAAASPAQTAASTGGLDDKLREYIQARPLTVRIADLNVPPRPVMPLPPSPAPTPNVSAGAGIPPAQPAAVAAAADEVDNSAMATARAEASTPTAGLQPPADSAPATDATVAAGANPDLQTVFRVKYVAQGVAYLEGGRSSGLAEGMKLVVKDTNLPAQQGATVDENDPRIVAELQVTGLAETSSVTDIHNPKREVKPGDLAYLSAEDGAALVAQRALSATRSYPAVITFTEGDPMDEEARAEIPRPPLPSVNRARGRIGLDYMGTLSHGASSVTSSDVGMVLRADITRINGTFWNLSGYWRGRLDARSSTGTQTLQDLINRTYHLSITYDNPNSALVAGVGRLYLPWASSLDTIDGGYFGRRLNPVTTAGVFAGSTPDPTSWDYAPDRRIAGAFVNFQGGSFDAFRYTSTSGLGLSTLNWQIDRPFIFFENAVFYNRYLSIYHSLQADSPRGNVEVAAPGPGLSRSFLTVRLQPYSRLELDFNHNYFRDIPTFDPSLIGLGLLDKYLFQGFSVGTRVEVVKQVFAYVNLGLSNRSGDTQSSLNQLYGLTFNRLPWFKLRADAHYSRFASSFGDGSYRSFSLSRNFGDDLRLEALVGDQRFTSLLAGNDNAKFLTGNFDWSFGSHYFLQSSFTVNRGGALSYDQWMMTWGYRFDNRAKHQ